MWIWYWNYWEMPDDPDDLEFPEWIFNCFKEPMRVFDEPSECCMMIPGTYAQMREDYD